MQQEYEQLSLFQEQISHKMLFNESANKIRELNDKIELYWQSVLYHLFAKIKNEIELKELILSIDTGKNIKCSNKVPSQDEIGIVKTSAVSRGIFLEEESKTPVDEVKLVQARLIKPADFLFLRANTIKFVGSCVIVNKISKKLMLSDKVIRFNLNNNLILADYLMYYLKSPQAKQQILKKVHGINESMQSITQENINRIMIPYINKLEQKKIICYFDKQMSTVHKMKKIKNNMEEKLKIITSK